MSYLSINHNLKTKECPECLGDGTVEAEIGVADFGAPLGGELKSVHVTCENCDGRGEIEDEGWDDENWSDYNPMEKQYGY